jgi:hypothetical protein
MVRLLGREVVKLSFGRKDTPLLRKTWAVLKDASDVSRGVCRLPISRSQDK